MDERHGFLLKGVIPKDRTNWVEPLGEWIANPELAAVGQSTAAAVLLIPTKTGKQTWALSFGMGLHAIEPATVVDGIGRKIAVRQADPNRLKSITHSRLDQRALIARTSIPGGDDLAAYGIGGIANLVSRVVTTAQLTGLHARAVAGSNPLEIRGADAIKGDIAWVPERPRQVVLVMCRDREVNAETLYSFSRMRLVSLAEEFELWNVKLSVQWVERR